MAQKQMFLMMLAVIIIGIAVMAGSDQFEKDHNAAVRNQMRNVIPDIAIRAQVWRRHPTVYGGKRSFLDFSLETIHANSYNMLGDITLTNKLPNSFRIVGVPQGDSTWSLIADVYPDSLAVAEHFITME